MKKRNSLTRTMMWISAVIATATPLTASAQRKYTPPSVTKRPVANDIYVAAENAQNRKYDDFLFVNDGSLDYAGRLVDVSHSSKNAIGITIAPTDPVLRTQLQLKKGRYGVVVTGVLANTPAAKAGVRQHDIIVSATGTGIAAGSDLSSVLRKAGKKPLALILLRGGKTLSLTIQPTPERKPTIWQPGIVAVGFAPTSRYMIGVTTKDATPELTAQLVLPPSTGRVITKVTAKSPAEAAGLQKHDVILKAGGAYVKSSGDLSKAIDKLKGKPISIEFLRAGRKQTCTMKPVKRLGNGTYQLYYTPNGQLLQSGIRTWNWNNGQLMSGPNNKLWRTQAGWDFTNVYWPRRPAGARARTIRTQIDAVTNQLNALQKSLDRLKKELATPNKPSKKTKKKKPAAKK